MANRGQTGQTRNNLVSPIKSNSSKHNLKAPSIPPQEAYRDQSSENNWEFTLNNQNKSSENQNKADWIDEANREIDGSKWIEGNLSSLMKDMAPQAIEPNGNTNEKLILKTTSNRKKSDYGNSHKGSLPSEGNNRQ